MFSPAEGSGKPMNVHMLYSTILTYFTHVLLLQPKNVVTSEREARSEFLLIYTKNLSMSGRPAGRGHAFERLISLEP